MKEGATLTFKTDNVGLFDFTLEEIEAMGLVPTKMTRDLHSSEYAEGNVVTEYERAFSEMGVKINMVEIEKPAGYKAPAFNTKNPSLVIYFYITIERISTLHKVFYTLSFLELISSFLFFKI